MGKSTAINGLVIEWFGHSSVGIYGKKVIYVDPFSEVLKGDEKKGDLIISTHHHRDHFDTAAINRLSEDSTWIIIKSGSERSDLVSVKIKELELNAKLLIDEIHIKSVHAYNTKRFRSPGNPYHPKGFGMGVIISVEGVKLYHAGDTDFIEPMAELKNENIDVALLPIGGTYTMDIEEAAEAVLAIRPRMVIPIHYNHIKGTEADPMEFKKRVEDGCKSQVIVL